ncbi:MAG: hypothetical protein K2L10_06755 [Ruminococcus sp.]|nr:hypothetical protein [Ruminococcus sp.]
MHSYLELYFLVEKAIILYSLSMCSESVEINNKSIMIVDYNCSSDGDAMTAEIIP